VNPAPLFRPLLASLVVLAAGGCSSSPGSDPGAAIATTSAVVIGGGLAYLTGNSDHKRELAEPRLYELAPGRFVVTNTFGWFTDRSESRRGTWQSQSAWVVDLTGATEARRIALSPDNLERWFWRDHTPDQLKPLVILPAKTPARVDGYEWDAENHALYIHYLRQRHRLALAQGPVPVE